jgi:protein-S-isoprenylcysteine O-methyltransferase Ste14
LSRESIEKMVFGIILPLYAVLAVLGIVANRVRVSRQIGRDPIIVRPLRGTDAPHRYLESVLLLGGGVLVFDILLNAMVPDVVAYRWAIPAIRLSTMFTWLGLASMTGGLILCAVAVTGLGTSWRIGIDRETPGSLVSGGVYKSVRHPIYSGMLMVVSGVALVTGDLISIAVAGAAWVGIPLQARLEEEFLISRHGDEYRKYKERTGRFWPSGLFGR